MELIDLAGFSKPITKLLDVFQAGCKFIFKPSYIRRIEMAKLDAEKMKDEYQMHKRIKDSIVDKIIDGIANESLSIREQRQLKNIADVYAYAENELRMLDSVSPEPVNDDWSSRFFDYAKDVSDDDIKIIWGKILAGEIKSPGSFSKSTLAALWNLDLHDAKCFVEMRDFVVDTFIPVQAFDFAPYGDLLAMSACGLAMPVDCKCTITNVDSFYCGSRIVKIKSCPVKDIDFCGFSLTRAGIQLLSLVQAKENAKFIQKIKDFAEQNSGQELELE